MSLLSALPMLVLLADPTSGPGWQQVARTDGITVFARQKQGSELQEMKAIGVIDAPPQKVYEALRDYENYKNTMPFTKESKVVEKSADGKTIWFYSIVDAPLVAKRDYTIKTIDESDWKDGKGFLKVSWSAALDKGPKEQEGMVRVKVNDGFWHLEPRDNGARTFATYYVFTDPGGSMPSWIVNKANGTAVPDVFRALRKVTAAKK